LVPASDGSDDLVGIGGPDERLGVVISLGEEALDGGLEIDQRSEHAALEPSLAELSKEALDGVEPGSRFRRVMEHKAGMPVEPGPDLGVLVASVIVEDHVDELAGRDLGFDRIEEADELLMPVPLHAAADDLAFEHVEGGKQRGRAIALVVMGEGTATAGLQRQAGLGAIECLDLRFLVDAEHDRVRRRIDIEADDIPQLGHELGVARQLELTDPMGLQAVRPPDALHRADADAGRFRHHLGRPMRGFARRIAEGQGHRALVHARRQRWNARGPRHVAQQTRHPRPHKPLLPAPYGHFARPRPVHDLASAQAIRRQQHDPRSPNVLLRAIPIADDRLQPRPVGRTHRDYDTLTHARPLSTSDDTPTRILMLGFYH